MPHHKYTCTHTSTASSMSPHYAYGERIHRISTHRIHAYIRACMHTYIRMHIPTHDVVHLNTRPNNSCHTDIRAHAYRHQSTRVSYIQTGRQCTCVCVCTYMIHKQQTSCSKTHQPSSVCSTLRDSSTRSHMHKAMLRSCRVCLGTLVIMTACGTPHRSTMLSHHTCTQACAQVACNNIPLTDTEVT
jgi:hypothetical protein